MVSLLIGATTALVSKMAGVLTGALLAAGLAAVVFGDTAAAATIAGLFAALNTYLLIRLQRPIRATHKAMVAPRRIVYDSDGRPIGTVLDLRGDPDFDMDALIEAERRHDDKA